MDPMSMMYMSNVAYANSMMMQRPPYGMAPNYSTSYGGRPPNTFQQ